ncbi:hypothetical protein DFH07DRAFT_730167, partial [Mycena maculata]
MPEVERRGEILKIPKVTTELLDNSGPEEKSLKPARTVFPLPRRGRDKLTAMKAANRKRVMQAETRAAFWKEIERLADPRPVPISVSADGLQDVFETRLNPAQILPPEFDSAQHKINKILAGLLPEKTEDTTPEGFFSKKWNEDDMGALKNHLRKHSLDS